MAIKHKVVLIVFLFSILATTFPHETYAQTPVVTSASTLVFDLSDKGYEDFLDNVSAELTDQYYANQAQAKALRQQKLVSKVKEYLQEQGSPLAQYVPILVTVRNWKKIVALSNAESSMCRVYPVGKSNCWGVGGSNLLDMGDNLGQGIVTMNHFLNVYPKNASLKYSQMSFEQMNGLYKQPPAQHWIDNNQTVYDDLTKIERSL